ncbi:MAG: hypothetical protein IJ246_13780 [Clostridia bacterium]|nr:hypothetical protein [Clostridia bacterium]
MKLTFLGTGAGEGYPGFWCRCEHCTYARTHGGRNIRAYSAAVLDDTVLLDCGPTAFPNASRFGKDLTQAQVLLITHPHEDHVLPLQLMWRAADESTHALPYAERTQHGGARFTPIQDLTIYGNAFTEEALRRIWDADTFQKNRMTFVRIQEGEAFSACGYRITPVRGHHGQPGFSHSYIIEKDGRCLLYALDSGHFDPDQQEILRQHVYHTVIMEGTYGLNSAGDENHMSLKKNLEWLQFFHYNHLCGEGFRFYLTHMSPHWCPPHDQYVDIAGKQGLEVAYDGLEIEI